MRPAVLIRKKHSVVRGPVPVLWGLLVVVWLLLLPTLPRGWAQGELLLDGIAAVVNNEIITISDVREAMTLERTQLAQTYDGTQLSTQERELYQKTLRALTDIQLQLARARQLQLQVTDREIDRQVETLKTQNQLSDDQLVELLQSRGMTIEGYRKQVREGLLIGRVINAEIRSRLTILDTELQEAYRERQGRYDVSGSQTVSHILFLVPQNASKEEEERLRAKTEGVLQELRQGGDFATLAKKYSEGPSAERGGEIGTFEPGDLLPAFEKAAAPLEPGQVSDVVRTRIGWHIIRLDKREAGHTQPFEDIKEDLKTELLRAKTEGKYEEWLEALRQRAYIKVLYDG